MLKIAWLGPPYAEVAGKRIRFETRKIAALFAYLSLNSQGNPREKLAALFWPEFDQTHALANLRRALSSLTRTLPPGSFEADRETIRWNQLTPIELDVIEFRASIQTARSHEHEASNLCASCLETLETTAALYRGDFLDGLNLPDCPEFDDWQYLLREELRREFAWILERLAGGFAGQAAWDKAAHAARRWISLDRLEVSAQIALVDIYVRSGQRSLAQRQVEEYTRLLKEELGQEPDKDTRALFLRALNQGRPSRLEMKPVQKLTPVFSHTLLKTKLYLPKVKPGRVNRSRLLSKLNGICEHKLSLISAPAGFGKTSLLAEWALRADHLVGWLSLDSGDNDPNRFLTYLCAAFNSLQEQIASNAQIMLESAQPVQPQSVITVLLKDTEEVGEPLVLVLDDYQFITAQPIHEALAYLLERASPSLHLVIASRADPPLPLARLRAQGELLELRMDDLRFTLDEAMALFNQVMGLDITPAEAQALTARTEGWAVGLQMAAISLQGAPDRAQIISTFSGSHRYILDYLIQEVLDRQPEHVRDFLLKTSILERLCGPLCDAILEDRGMGIGDSTAPTPYPLSPSNSQSVLEYLECANLFLVPLDEERRWYRYHHLFADLLTSQLQRFQPMLIPELHLRASLWYEKHGQLDPAIEHALAAGDFERAGDLVEQDAQRLAFRVEFARIQHWIDRLPQEMVIRRAWIAITQGWLWLVAGKLPTLTAWMDRVEENYRTLWANTYSEIDREDLAANITSLRAYIAFFAGELPRSIGLANRALQLISPANEALHVRLLVQIGEAYLMIQDHTRAARFLYQGIERGIHIQDLQSTTTASMRLFKCLRLLGKLTEAGAMVQGVLQALSETGRLRSPIAGKPELCWGDLLHERGQMEAAGEWLDQGLRHARQYNIPYDIVAALVYKVKWLYTQKKWDQALQLLDEGAPLMKTYSIPPSIAYAWGLWRASVCLEKGDLQAVEAWVQTLQLRPDDATLYLKEEAYIVLSRLHLRKGEHAETQALLNKLAVGAEAGGRNGNLIQIYLLQALAYHAQGSTELAQDILKKCLSLACPENYLATFLDEGWLVQELLIAQRAAGVEPPIADYVDRLIQAFGQWAQPE